MFTQEIRNETATYVHTNRTYFVYIASCQFQTVGSPNHDGLPHVRGLATREAWRPPIFTARRDVFGAGTAQLYSPRYQHRFGKQGLETKYGCRMVASQSVARVFFPVSSSRSFVFIGLCVDFCFFSLLLSCFLGSRTVYVLCGCDIR